MANKATEDLKIPPYSLEAEQAVLGGLMLENSAWEKVQERLNEQDFFRPEHRIIFRAMTQLANSDQPFDVITLSEALKKQQELTQIGGEIYLFELARQTPSVTNIPAYVEIVAENALLRHLIETAQDIATHAFAPQGRKALELLDHAETKILKIGNQNQRGTGPENIQTVMARTFERVQKLKETGGQITGLSTGYLDFDRLTSGLQPGELVIIAGRPSMGKTTFAVNIAEYATVMSPQPVLIFSMEMPSESLGMRLFSSLGRIDQQKIRTGDIRDDDWMKITSAVNLLGKSKLFIDDTPALTPVELRSRARRIAKEHGNLSLIVIDYLQLMRVPGLQDNRTAEISEISRSLKALAKELNVPIIALSQLNRSLEQRHDKRPVMSDLRESGAIEQDADLIIFIYRDEVYNKDSNEKGIAEIIIAKQRNGPIGMFKLSFFGQYTRFDNYAPF